MDEIDPGHMPVDGMRLARFQRLRTPGLLRGLQVARNLTGQNAHLDNVWVGGVDQLNPQPKAAIHDGQLPTYSCGWPRAENGQKQSLENPSANS